MRPVCSSYGIVVVFFNSCRRLPSTVRRKSLFVPLKCLAGDVINCVAYRSRCSDYCCHLPRPASLLVVAI